MGSQKARVGWKPQLNDARVASARIRCLEPLRVLERRGLPVEIFQPRHQNQYEVVVLQKLYDLAHLELARELQAQGTRVVFDLCDNHFYNPDNDPELAQRVQWLSQMIQIADVVTVASETLAHTIPCPTVLVRDGISPATFSNKVAREIIMRQLSKNSRCLDLVWFGNYGGARGHRGMLDLLNIAGILTDFSQKTPLRLSVISNSRSCYEKHIHPLSFSTRYEEWGNSRRFYNRFSRYDICVLPITSNPFSVCKSNNRLALSLYLGIAVIADAIPSYHEFAPFCVLDNWSAGLERYCDASSRKADVIAGQNYVNKHYTVEHSADDWWRVFEQLLS